MWRHLAALKLSICVGPWLVRTVTWLVLHVPQFCDSRQRISVTLTFQTREKRIFWILFHQQRVLNLWLIFSCVLTRTVIGWRGRLKECSHTRRRVNEICMVRCTAKSTQVVSPGGYKSTRCRFAGHLHLCAKHQHIQIAKFDISSSGNVPFDSSWAVWHCWSSQEVGEFPKKLARIFAFQTAAAAFRSADLTWDLS